MRIRNIVFIIAVSIALVNCNKDDKQGPQNILIGTWRLTGESVIGECKVQTQEDEIGPAQNCTNDNTYQFRSDNIAIKDEGNIKCIPAMPQTKQLAYYFDQKNMNLTIDTTTYHIIRLTANTLLLEICTEMTINNNKMKLAFKYTKQN